MLVLHSCDPTKIKPIRMLSLRARGTTTRSAGDLRPTIKHRNMVPALEEIYVAGWLFWVQREGESGLPKLLGRVSTCNVGLVYDRLQCVLGFGGK